MQQLEIICQLEDDCGNEADLTFAISGTSYIPKARSIGSEDSGGGILEMIRIYDQMRLQEYRPCENLIYESADVVELSLIIKRIRLFFERKYELDLNDIPWTVLDQLATYEVMFHIERHPTTECIWNVEHQEERCEVFFWGDAGVWYRQKCLCSPCWGNDTTNHANDMYCPRNISDRGDEGSVNGNGLGDNTGQNANDVCNQQNNSGWGEPSDMNRNGWSDGWMPGNNEEKQKQALEEAYAMKEQALQAIKNMVGMKPAMEHINNIMAKIELAKRQGVDLKEERFGTIFLGNSGTGELRNISDILQNIV
jgi:hypothetical protein